MFGPGVLEADDTWHNAGDVAQQTIVDIANRAKDRHDETLDAKRVHGGQTIEEFLEGPR